MKNILILLLLFISTITFAQTRVTVISVPDANTTFKIAFPAGTQVCQENTGIVYELTAYTVGTKTLTTATKRVLASGSEVDPIYANDSSKVVWFSDSTGTFVTPYDSIKSHNWVENNFIKFSDSSGNYVTPFDTVGKWLSASTVFNTDTILVTPLSTNDTIYDAFTNTSTRTGYQAGAANMAINNTFVGYQSGNSNTTGTRNTSVGHQSLFTQTAGIGNCAIGDGALDLLTNTGNYNVALGTDAMGNASPASHNIGVGYGSLFNTTGNYNTGIGAYSGLSISSGELNVAIGYNAARNGAAITGLSNIFIGDNSGYNCTGVSNYNTIIGSNAGYSINEGDFNTSNGYGGLYNNTAGSYNVAIGSYSGYNNIAGFSNIFIGDSAGYFYTSSDKLYIHNGKGITNIRTMNEHSLIIGTFNSDSSLQQVTVNGNDSIIGELTVTEDANLNGDTIRIPNSVLIFGNDTVTDMPSLDKYNFTKIGRGVASNLANYDVQINAGALAGYVQYTNTATGTAITDGTLIGIDALGNTVINNLENDTINIKVNSQQIIQCKDGGANASVIIGNASSDDAAYVGDVKLIGTPVSLGIVNMAASGVGGGGHIYIQQDDGTAMLSTESTGDISWRGAYNTAHDMATSSQIKSIATGTWTGTTVHPASLTFWTHMNSGNTLERLRIASAKVLTHNTATSIFTAAFPPDSSSYGNSCSGQLMYSVSIRGTDGVQTETGVITYSGVEYLGVTTTTGTANAVNSQTLSSGTLTTTPTLEYAAGVWTIKVTANSNLTTPVYKFTYILLSHNGGSIIQTP